ncbi:MAG: phage protein NinX family protein [Alphaproteobacteria bacterium]|jgi:hypothetical protein|nr:DUF2591 family protein [Rhizobiaceae bacterium]
MKKFWISIDNLNDDGASYLLQELFGVVENGASSWKVIGPLIERHRVSLTHSSKSNEWDAQVEIGEDIEFTDATNPRLAVARILIKKTLLENPSNAYTIKLPARTAFAFGLDRDSQSFSVSFLSQGGELDEDEVIFLDITP